MNKLIAFFFIVVMVVFYFVGYMAGHQDGYYKAKAECEPVKYCQEIVKTVYRYPNSPPYQELDEPINYDQAIALLSGMRLSHIQILKWKFEKDPGFGIADKDFQAKCIKWYDQLIEYVQRQEIR